MVDRQGTAGGNSAVNCPRLPCPLVVDLGHSLRSARGGQVGQTGAQLTQRCRAQPLKASTASTSRSMARITVAAWAA